MDDEDHARGQGRRALHSPPRRAGEGHRAASSTWPTSSRAGLLHAKLLRSPHAHARILRIDTSRGQGAARRARRPHRRRHPAAQEEGADARARRAGHRPRGLRRPAGGRGRRRRAGHRRGGARPDRGRVPGAAGRRSIRSRRCSPARRRWPTRAPRPTPARRWPTPGVAVAKSEAPPAEGGQHRPAGAPAARRRGQGLRRVRPGPREDLPRADGPPGLSRAARRPGRVGHARASSRSGPSTQGSFNTRSEVADVLGIPENRIKVIPMECGGGFGGKIRALCEPITAMLAQATGRPVRYVMTRREELQAGMPAPQVIIRLKTGVKKDGTLMALEARDDPRLGRVSRARC